MNAFLAASTGFEGALAPPNVEIDGGTDDVRMFFGVGQIQPGDVAE